MDETCSTMAQGKESGHSSSLPCHNIARTLSRAPPGTLESCVFRYSEDVRLQILNSQSLTNLLELVPKDHYVKDKCQLHWKMFSKYCLKLKNKMPSIWVHLDSSWITKIFLEPPRVPLFLSYCRNRLPH